MKQTIYVDELVLINLVINYILLLITAKICAAPTKRLRLLAAAAIGALYAVAVVMPFGTFLTNPFVKLTVGVLMVLSAFGGQNRIIRLSLVFIAISAAFGGAVTAVALMGGGSLYGLLTPVSLRVLLLTFAVSYLVLVLVFKRAARSKSGGVVKLTLKHAGREVDLMALRDTGNALVDPLTGHPVIVAGVGDIRELFPQAIRKIIADFKVEDAAGVIEALAEKDKSIRFRLVPYSAVGVPGGMLLAFRPDEIIINGEKKTGMLLALSPNSVSDSGTYSALLGA